MAGHRRWLWLLAGLIAASLLVVVGAGLFAPWLFAPKRHTAQSTQKEASSDVPLDGDLIVAVRAPARFLEPLSLEDPGALPVRAGGSMSLQVQLNQPAYAYLVWLDCEGNTAPLYPWNLDTLEVQDISQPPPLRRSAKLLQSPLLLGGGWKFGERGGLQTVLLLARRSRLDESTKLGELIEPFPPAPMRHREEVAFLRLKKGEDTVSTLFAKNRGDEAEALAADEPLRALMVRLGEHFELVRAVRFAHEGE